MTFWKRHISGYSNYRDLLGDYFQACQSEQRQPSFHDLYYYNYVDRDRTIVAFLIGSYGLLEMPKVIEKVNGMASLLLQYQNAIENLRADFELIIKYNRQDLQARRFRITPLPKRIFYSWQAQSAPSSSQNQQEHIVYGLIRGLFILPFPQQIARVLTIDQLGCLKGHLTKNKERLTIVYQTLFEQLNSVNRSDEPLPFLFSGPDALDVEEAMIIQGACLKYPCVYSYVDMLQQWGEAEETSHSIEQWFKISSLIREKKVFQLDGSTSTQIDDGPQSPQSNYMSFERLEEGGIISFRDFLVERTMDKVITPICPISLPLNTALEQCFKANEEIRLDFVFLAYALHAIFDPDTRQKHSLKCLLEIAYPLVDRSEFERASRIVKSLFPDQDLPPAHFANTYLLLFSLKQFCPSVISSLTKQRFAEGFYQALAAQSNTPFLLVELYEKVAKQKIGCVCFPNYTLSEDRNHSDPLHLLFTSIWEMVLHGHLPDNCLELLVEESLIDDANPFRKQIFVCAYEWFCLFPDQSTLINMDENLLKFRIKVSKRLNSMQNPLSIFEKGLAIMQRHGAKKQDSYYGSMEAALYFVNCCYYFELSFGAKSFLFERLLKASTLERQLSYEELTAFGRSFLPLNRQGVLKRDYFLEIPRHSWKSNLQQAYKNKMAINENQPGKLPESKKSETKESMIKCLSQLSVQFNQEGHSPIDFQIAVIEHVEKLIKTPFPFMMVLILYMYCPYIPLQSEKEEDLHFIRLLSLLKGAQGLKLKYDFRNQESLFIPPSIVKEIDESYQCLLDPDLSISSQIYPNKRHANCLETHFGALFSVVQSKLLPSVPFCHVISKLAKKKNHPLSNSIQLSLETSPETDFYTGHWQGMAYMLQWKWFESSSALEVVLWHSVNKLDSFYFQIPLALCSDQLTPRMMRLMNMMFESVVFDAVVQEIEYVPLPSEDQVGQNTDLESMIEQIESEEDEIRYCCMSSREFQLKWNAYLKETRDEEGARVVFRFVKELKIKTRLAQAYLFADGEDSAGYHEPAIHFLSDRRQIFYSQGIFSTVPAEHMREQLSRLCEVFQTTHAEITMDCFKVLIGGGTWLLSFHFDPCKVEIRKKNGYDEALEVINEGEIEIDQSDQDKDIEQLQDTIKGSTEADHPNQSDDLLVATKPSSATIDSINQSQLIPKWLVITKEYNQVTALLSSRNLESPVVLKHTMKLEALLYSKGAIDLLHWQLLMLQKEYEEWGQGMTQ